MSRFTGNDAYWIAAQCGTSALAWATTGVGKSAIAKAFAETLGYGFRCFIPSMHLPEDIGGCIDINRNDNVVDVYLMRWLKQYAKPKQVLMIDEVTTAPQAMRPPLLSLINERMIGDFAFHPTTIVLCAANPPEMAPNSAPLEGSLLNRVYHHDWKFPFDSWYRGMMAGGKFESQPSDFPVVGDYSSRLPKWCSLIARLVQRNPAIRETTSLPEDEKAFPSPRVWHQLAHCLAGADKVNADGDIMSQLATGLVGSNAAAQLMRWIAASDLYDANEVIDGTETIEYGEDRLDQLIFLPCGILDALKDDHSPSRIDRASEVLIEMAENGLVDSVMPVFGELSSTYPKYKIPKKLLSRYGNLMKQIGGVA